jgi:hypothetical protein
VEPITQGAIVSPDLESAVLEIKSLPVIDQPEWPKLNAPATPAQLTLRVVWKSLGEKVLYRDPEKWFQFEGFKAMAQAESQVSVPSIGFEWKSDPIETSRAGFAIIGKETNGKYFA